MIFFNLQMFNPPLNHTMSPQELQSQISTHHQPLAPCQKQSVQEQSAPVKNRNRGELGL